MIVYEEMFITVSWSRGCDRARLTQTEFTMSVILMRWVVLRVPLASIIAVHVYRILRGYEVAVDYHDPAGRFTYVRFWSRNVARWRRAFELVGVRVVED